MDLKNNRITVGELMDHPPARALLTRKFPLFMKRAPVGAARAVTLEQLLAFVSPYVSSRALEDTLNELKKL